jgi:hypothetical protein
MMENSFLARTYGGGPAQFVGSNPRSSINIGAEESVLSHFPHKNNNNTPIIITILSISPC